METCLKNSLEIQELSDIISCIILIHMEKKPSEHYDGSSGVGYPIPSNSTTEGLVLLIATIDVISC